MGALTGEQRSGGAPDSRRRAGNQRHFALEPVVRGGHGCDSIHIPSARALPFLAALVLVAGCGGGSSGGGSSSGSAASGTPALGVQSGGLGDIVVDGQNRTVYLFKRDTPSKSACFGACAQNWPPVRVSGKPVAGPGIKASLLGTAARSDGKRAGDLQRPPGLSLRG